MGWSVSEALLAMIRGVFTHICKDGGGALTRTVARFCPRGAATDILHDPSTGARVYLEAACGARST